MAPFRLPNSIRPRPHRPTQWKELDPGPRVLLQELTSLYWLGVERDLRDILRALQVWSQVKYNAVLPSPSSPQPEDWLGFESFVNRATKEDSTGITYDILFNVDAVNGQRQYEGIERMAQMLLEAAGFLDIDKVVEYRAPEYDLGVWLRPRAPQLEMSLLQNWATLPDFQLSPCSHCSELIRGSRFQCIQGCAVTSSLSSSAHLPVPPGPQRPVVLCETCARNQVHPFSHLTKIHKNCILATSISDQQACQFCLCWKSPNSGLQRGQLYPFRKGDRGRHDRNCHLLQLAVRHRRAKYNELVRLNKLRDAANVGLKNNQSTSSGGSITGKQDSGGKSLRRSSTTSVTSEKDSSSVLPGSRPPSLSGRFRSVVNVLSRSSSSKSQPCCALESLPEESSYVKPCRHSLPVPGMSIDNKVTSSIKRIALRPAVQMAVKDIPFGNVHMALMIGPLIVENGIPDSKSGALITVRDRLQLHPVRSSASPVLTNLAVGQDRRLWKASRPPRQRRIKTFMKQVAGGTFCGIHNESLEGEIIKYLAQQSISCVYEPMKSEAYNEAKTRNALRGILPKLQRLLQKRLQVYLYSIVNKLFDPEVHLAWDIMNNHCQKFCEIIIDRRIFGSFIADKGHCQQHGSNEPLYLVSFVCRFGSHDGFPKKVRPVSKLAAPNGLTEEYLLRYRRYGHHNDSDIVDTLMEYWTDWGGFPGPIFPHQHLFPWDCTEAHSKEGDAAHKTKCGNCKMAKHLWAFPFDSWSIVQLHLYRERRFYKSNTSDAPVLSDIEWAKNRFETLEALQILSRVAVAITKSSTFREKCRWSFKSHAIDFPHLRNYGPRRRLRNHKYAENGPGGSNRISRASIPKTNAHGFTDRVKLAGIHRAQPKSHLFEHDKFHDCTLATWADLVYEDQVAAYKKLRDYRASDLDGILRVAKSRRARWELRDHSERLEQPGLEGNRQNWLQQVGEDRGYRNNGTNNDVDVQSIDSSSQESDDLDQSYDGEPALFDFAIGDTDDDSTYGTGMDNTYDGTEDPDHLGDDWAQDSNNTSSCDCIYWSPDDDQYTDHARNLDRAGSGDTDRGLSNGALGLAGGAALGEGLGSLAINEDSDNSTNDQDNPQDYYDSGDYSNSSTLDFMPNFPSNNGLFDTYGELGDYSSDGGFGGFWDFGGGSDYDSGSYGVFDGGFDSGSYGDSYL